MTKPPDPLVSEATPSDVEAMRSRVADTREARRLAAEDLRATMPPGRESVAPWGRHLSDVPPQCRAAHKIGMVRS